MPYHNKTIISLDIGADVPYYRLMQAWEQNDGIDFCIHNAHDVNVARDTSQGASIKEQLAECMRGSKQFILLVGNHDM
jgi:hypothetical protein